MSKPPLFLDTTIQIGRIVGPIARRIQLQETLTNYRLLTSTYVLGEFLRTLVKDAIQLYHLIEQYAHFDEVITNLGQHPNKREASRMMLLLGTILRGERTTLSTSFAPEMRLQVRDRLARYIKFTLIDHFLFGIDEVLDTTQCGLARERPMITSLADGNALRFRLRSQCTRYVRECDLAEQMGTWQPQLAALANGLAHESDPSLLRMGQLARQIIENPILARGRNCTWHLGDLVIALELPADVPLYTTNVRHFAPILAILGKKLHEGMRFPTA
ncbi:MAG: hypothetical protein DYG89_29755 [Caldilinea sp. CFX5]|nr:hypothetical protein [Caldilinea sp. CFX5]